MKLQNSTTTTTTRLWEANLKASRRILLENGTIQPAKQNVPENVPERMLFRSKLELSHFAKAKFINFFKVFCGDPLIVSTL